MKPDTGTRNPAIEAAIREARMITLRGRRMGALYFNERDVDDKPEYFAMALARLLFMPLNVTLHQGLHKGVPYSYYVLVGMSSKFDRIREDDEVPAYKIEFNDDGSLCKAIRIPDE